MVSLTLISSGSADTKRYAVCDAKGEPLWFGRFFEGDKDFQDTKESAEISAAKKAIWLASQAKEKAGVQDLELTLVVAEKWVSSATEATQEDKKSGGKARQIGLAAKRLNVLLKVKVDTGIAACAIELANAQSGFKSWKDNDLGALVNGPVETGTAPDQSVHFNEDSPLESTATSDPVASNSDDSFDFS